MFRKKKSSKSKSKDKEQGDTVESALKEAVDPTPTSSPAGSSRNSPAASGPVDKKTSAEKRFDEVQKRRVCTIAAFSGSKYGTQRSL